MKRWLLLGMGVALAGCATEPKTAALPSKEMSEMSGVSLEQLERGRHIYETDCSRCHVPMLPGEASEGDWHVVVPGMAWNAGISREDEDAVLAYILAAKQMP